MQLSSVGRRIAFFGGSFDPPHCGHLAIARAARTALRLDTVLFAPVGAQPLKPKGATAPFADRAAMTRLAIAGEPGFTLSLIDAPSAEGTPNYTLETLRRLRTEMSADDLLFCLMGADSLRSLRHWRGAGEIPFTAALVVASRPRQSLDDLAACLPEGVRLQQAPTSIAPPLPDAGGVEIRSYNLRDLSGREAPFYLLPGLDVEVSASAIRDQIRAGDPSSLEHVVPAAVANYIRTHGLYGRRHLPTAPATG